MEIPSKLVYSCCAPFFVPINLTKAQLCGPDIKMLIVGRVLGRDNPLEVSK